tara:strand:+ start:99 stop:326 length:228 start_codon:yes stop_codon:yes gene_type:complete
MKKIILILLLSGCAHISPPVRGGDCPSDKPVKGNADSFIYHTKDSPYYQQTNAEICFDNASAAAKFGYRPFYQKR